MAIYPFILLRDKDLKNNVYLINHERIHLRQQLEFLILPFYLWYFMEYLIRWIQYGDSQIAYYNISFEREAYANELDLKYLENRKFWSFIDYIKTPKGR